MVKVTFYVPDSHVEAVKQAMFDAGAGKIGPYDHCAWQCKGTGQFRPLPGSQPHLGQTLQIHHEIEWQVEMVCEDHLLEVCIDALHKAHPYETPAYAAWPIWQRSHEQ